MKERGMWKVNDLGINLGYHLFETNTKAQFNILQNTKNM